MSRSAIVRINVATCCDCAYPSAAVGSSSSSTP